MSPDLQCVSVIQMIRAQNACVSPACEETMLGPTSLEERGDRRRPRYRLTSSLCVRPQSENDQSARGGPGLSMPQDRLHAHRKGWRIRVQTLVVHPPYR